MSGFTPDMRSGTDEGGIGFVGGAKGGINGAAAGAGGPVLIRGWLGAPKSPKRDVLVRGWVVCGGRPLIKGWDGWGGMVGMGGIGGLAGGVTCFCGPAKRSYLLIGW